MLPERATRTQPGKTPDPETDGQKNDILAIAQAYGISDSDPAAKAWLGIAGSLHRRAHRDALAPPRPFDDSFKEDVERFEEMLDVVLEQLEAKFNSQVIPRLDGLADKLEPTNADATSFINSVPFNRATHWYFFERLKKRPDESKWLEPLKTAGFFKRVPPAGSIRGQGCDFMILGPPQCILARVAATSPQTVYDIIAEMPDTDNIYVLDNLNEALLKMPRELSALAATRAQYWAQKAYGHSLPRRLVAFATHITGVVPVEDSLRVIRGLLELRPYQDDRIPIDTAVEHWRVIEPELRVGGLGAEDLVEKDLPEYVKVAGTRAFSLLCEVLDQATLYPREGEASTMSSKTTQAGGGLE